VGAAERSLGKVDNACGLENSWFVQPIGFNDVNASENQRRYKYIELIKITACFGGGLPKSNVSEDLGKIRRESPV